MFIKSHACSPDNTTGKGIAGTICGRLVQVGDSSYTVVLTVCEIYLTRE